MPPYLIYFLLILLGYYIAKYREKPNKYFLYLAIFTYKSEKHFKLGITNNVERRVKEHKDNGYNIESVLYFTGTKSEVQAVETLLKRKHTQYSGSVFKRMLGYTEVRNYNIHFQDVIEDIEKFKLKKCR